MANSIVALRAYRDGLHLIIRPHLSITEVEVAIQQEISRMNRSLAGASVQIDLKSPTLKEEEIELLSSKLQESYDLTVRGVEVADEPVAPPIAAAPTTHVISQTTDTRSHRDSEPSRIVPYTIRSGQTEEFPQGSLIIYGDVNSGSEVRAGGDIVILGTLRGSAYAGMNGRLSAVIIAMDFAPLQLQIGNFVNRSSVNQQPRGYPEIARIGAEDVIIVEKFVKF
jgi:septum site-determining protein MinC